MANVGRPEDTGKMGPGTKYSAEQMQQLNDDRDMLLKQEARGDPGTYGAEGKPPAPNPFDKYDTAHPSSGNPFDKYDNKSNRALNDVQQVGAGVLNAGANLLGMPGDIRKAFGMADVPHLPDTQEWKDKFSSWTGRTLPEAEYPEGPWIQSGTQGAYSMMSPSKVNVATGALSGLLGEGAENMLSGSRIYGNIAGLAPAVVNSLHKPWDVKSIGPWVKRIGEGAIERAGAAADDAAKAIETLTTSLAAQEPRLRPVFNWLKGTKGGQPLQDLEENTKAALGVLDPATVPKRTWDPKFGWQDTPQNVANLIVPKSNPQQFRGMIPDIERGSTTTPGKWLRAIPGKYGNIPAEVIGQMASGGRLEQLAQDLASPDAAKYLLGLTDYSTSGRVSKTLAQALMSADLQQK